MEVKWEVKLMEVSDSIFLKGWTATVNSVIAYILQKSRRVGRIIGIVVVAVDITGLPNSLFT